MIFNKNEKYKIVHAFFINRHAILAGQIWNIECTCIVTKIMYALIFILMKHVIFYASLLETRKSKKVIKDFIGKLCIWSKDDNLKITS